MGSSNLQMAVIGGTFRSAIVCAGAAAVLACSGSDPSEQNLVNPQPSNDGIAPQPSSDSTVTTGETGSGSGSTSTTNTTTTSATHTNVSVVSDSTETTPSSSTPLSSTPSSSPARVVEFIVGCVRRDHDAGRVRRRGHFGRCGEFDGGEQRNDKLHSQHDFGRGNERRTARRGNGFSGRRFDGVAVHGHRK